MTLKVERLGRKVERFKLTTPPLLCVFLNMEKLELKKPRAAVEIANTISLVQRKAFNCMMIQSVLIPKPKGQKYHRISIKELCHLTGYRQKDFIYLDQQLEEMQTTLIRWSSGKSWGRVQFLGHVFYEEGTGMLEFSFSEKLIDLVKVNKLYNQLDIGSMREIQSKHALALYEMCSGFRATPTFSAGTGWRLLSDMKQLLCGGEDVYPQFKDFNKWVLKPAIKEINEVTDINIIMETQKQGRSIQSLRFFVTSSEEYKDILLEKPSIPSTTKFGEGIDRKQQESAEEWSSPEEMLDFFRG